MSTENLPFDFAHSEHERGFHLHRLEVYNWGTFDKKIWTIAPEGHNAFATGDVGSGKSTLVDALTTLLVPPKRIIYNKAAGAETRERDLTTYVRGAYKTEQSAEGHKGKAAYLRDERSYSALLAIFFNKGLEQTVTLAQVFRAKDSQGAPERFYLIAEGPLSITQDLSNVDGTLTSLKRQLRKRSGVELFDSFETYATQFRRIFGIRSSQALDLFFQTVSMKSVGNLTDFVREHMLDSWPVQDEIDEQCRNFEDLDRLHRLVVRAREQIEHLRPLMQGVDQFQRWQLDKSDLLRCRDLLSGFFSERKLLLYREKLERLSGKLERLQARKTAKTKDKADLLEEQDGLIETIHAKGGSRLQSLERQIEAETAERDRRNRQSSIYRENAPLLGLAVPDSPESFVDNKKSLALLDKELRHAKEEHQKRGVDLEIEFRDVRQQEQLTRRELQSLQSRKSNIPLDSLSIRERLAESLGVDEDRLPFIGELLQVPPDQRHWKGALERVLRPFALSLLVPEDLYARVTQYVNQTHLKAKLVYFRADEEHTIARAPREGNSLVAKVQVRRESPFHDWLWDELCHRYDYACCEDLTDFQRRPTAITPQGQIKSGGKRHEKDDRHHLNDRSRYVLGWDNQEKLRILSERQLALQAKAQGLAGQVARFASETQKFDQKSVALQRLSGFTAFEDMDWASSTRKLDALLAEKKTFEAAHQDLEQIKRRLEETKARLIALDEELADLNRRVGETEHDVQSTRNLEASCSQEVDCVTVQDREKWFPLIEAAGNEERLIEGIDLANCEKRERELRDKLQSRLDALQKRLDRKRDDIIGMMKDFLQNWPEEAKDMDANIEASGEFGAVLIRLEQEDLPRHEERFKQKLNEDTINGIALFQERLDRESRQIREKIEVINGSLRAIDYNPGSYIMLQSKRSTDPEIADFTERLRSITSNVVGTDTLYTEEKFLQVKEIIDRLKGREGQVDSDRRWRTKVTDVRNWYHFAALELWRSDDSEKEYYPDSGGKSGGQKEKLAYTVLGAALAYQFALSDHDSARSRTFRLVAIDEAFGRGSDDSTRYALELFGKLDLQLFIVTPLQKVNVIENYVQRVHFVHNADGMSSQVRNLTIEEYRKERDEHDQLSLAQAHQGESQTLLPAQ